MESMPDMPVTAMDATPESVSLLKPAYVSPRIYRDFTLPLPKGGIPNLKLKLKQRVDSDDKVNLS